MVFDCEKAELRPYFCPKCPFDTNILVTLHTHLRKSHTENSQVGETVAEENDFPFKKHTCYSCFFETYSILQIISHPKKCSQTKKSVDGLDQSYHCDHCEYKTRTKINLQSHLNLKHPHEAETQWLECDQCSYKTKWARCLRLHLMKHLDDNNIDWFQCDYCPYKTIQKRYLSYHINTVHPNESTAEWIQCDICDFRTKSRDLLRKHHIIKHMEKSLKCDKCEFKTKYKLSLREHKILKHKERIPFQWLDCDQCNFKAFSERRLETHKRNRHSTKITHSLIKCDYCDFKFKEKSRLLAHVNTSHPHYSTAKWLECYNCDFTTKSPKILYRHVKNAHMNENGSYECSKCTYKTEDRRTFRTHVLTHSNEINTGIKSRSTLNKKDSTEIKLVHCDYCSYKGKNKKNLSQHIITKHPNETTAPWLYCQYCDFTTKSRDTIIKHHQWKHTDVKNATKNENGLYECSKCSYKTEDIRRLRTHVWSHSEKINTNFIQRDQGDFKTGIKSELGNKKKKDSTEIKLIDCDHCSYKGNKKNLKQHIITKHPNETTAPWLNCDYCDFTTKSRDSLNKHYKWKHKGKKPKTKKRLKNKKLEHKDQKPFQ